MTCKAFCFRLKEYFKFLKSLMRTNINLLFGMWKLTRLPQPAVTVFGGARISKDSIYAKQAEDLARRLALKGFSIITGGGAGIMESANYGAYQAALELGHSSSGKTERMTSLGIGLLWLKEVDGKKLHNQYVQEQIIMYHFFSRKWLLVRYSIGFVVFPGGFGTLDEIFEVITLIQTSRMPKLPIILMGQEYWQSIIDWATTKALKQGLISQQDLEIVSVANNVDEAIRLLCKECGKQRPEKMLYEQ